MAIIAILTDGGVGGTFLSWSIHYLAGHEKYFNSANNQWQKLTDSPLNNTNAHNFKPNQPNTYKEFNLRLTNLLNCKSEDFHSIYFHQFEEPPQNLFQETQQAINKITPIANKLIVLTNQSKNYLYQKSFRNRVLRQKFTDPDTKNLSDEEQLEDFITHFYKESADKWKKLQLTKVWDRREFLALNLVADTLSIAPFVDLSTNHFDIDCLEFFNSADSMIVDLFDYLEIKLDSNRLANWLIIYQSWRKIHYNRLNFLWYFDKIIEYILNGYYMDLCRLDLDLVQEAFIQRELIYKHNLNLKTWKLEKFANTKQLHDLLEPNIHILKTN